jgi:hypothetical protein
MPRLGHRSPWLADLFASPPNQYGQKVPEGCGLDPVTALTWALLLLATAADLAPVFARASRLAA